MKKIVMSLLILCILIGCGSSAKTEKLGKYEYTTEEVSFNEQTEGQRKYFEKTLVDEDMLNVAMGIYQSDNVVSWTGENEVQLVKDLNSLYNYYINNDYDFTYIKLIYAYSVYDVEFVDKDGLELSKAYDFIDYMENHEYEYTNANIEKWDKYTNKNYYYGHVIEILKTMKK